MSIHSSKFKELKICLQSKEVWWYVFKVSRIRWSNSTYYVSSTSTLLDRSVICRPYWNFSYMTNSILICSSVWKNITNLEEFWVVISVFYWSFWRKWQDLLKNNQNPFITIRIIIHINICIRLRTISMCHQLKRTSTRESISMKAARWCKRLVIFTRSTSTKK